MKLRFSNLLKSGWKILLKQLAQRLHGSMQQWASGPGGDLSMGSNGDRSVRQLPVPQPFPPLPEAMQDPAVRRALARPEGGSKARAATLAPLSAARAQSILESLADWPYNNGVAYDAMPRRSGVTAMGIFSRTRDIVAANVNELLDRAEDPAKTIRLVIMEMEETLVEVRASAARTIADQKEMRRTVIKLEKAASDWDEKAELALSKGRDDLATAALMEKQKVRAAAEQLRVEVDMLDEQLTGYEEDIVKLENKLNEARARQSALLSRLETAEKRAKARALTRGQRVEEAFSRFEVMERRVDMAEGRVEAFDLGGKGRSLDDEFSDLRASDAVAAELAALKARIASREG
jgi:phage shock protein A